MTQLTYQDIKPANVSIKPNKGILCGECCRQSPSMAAQVNIQRAFEASQNQLAR